MINLIEIARMLNANVFKNQAMRKVFPVLDQRPEEFVAKYGIHIETFLRNNPTGGLLYHGNRHLLGVAYLSFLAAKQQGLDEFTIRNLVIAGLTHDYDYQNHVDDELNVKHTKAAMTDNTVFSMNHTSMSLFLIEGSKFPHVPYSDTAQYAEALKILRSADMIYSTVFCDFNTLKGLWLEYGNRMDCRNGREFIVRNIDFISKLKVDNPVLQRMNDLCLGDAIKVHEHEYTRSAYAL